MLDESSNIILKLLVSDVKKLENFLYSSGLETHINWLLAINAGSLLWFLGNIDKFTVFGKLAYKWFFILGLFCLLVSVTIMFSLRCILFKVTLTMQKIKLDLLKRQDIDSSCFENFQSELEKLDRIIPSERVGTVADVFFILGLFIMFFYVVIFLVFKI